MGISMLRRNLDLWEDRKLFNDTYVYLSKKYAISRERCRQIYLKVEYKYETYNKRNKSGIPMYRRRFEEIEIFYFERANRFLKGEGYNVSSNNKNDPV